MPERLITADPGCRPVIAGTHVTVEEVLKELAGSEAVDVILTAHPELDRDAVQAALTFAAEAVHRTASALLRIPLCSMSPEFLNLLKRGHENAS